MILVRDVFRLKFGKAKDVKALMQETKKFLNPEQVKSSRVLFDLTGPSYTMVLESAFNSLADFEASFSSVSGRDDWRSWYQKFIPLVESSYKEIFTIQE